MKKAILVKVSAELNGFCVWIKACMVTSTNDLNLGMHTNTKQSQNHIQFSHFLIIIFYLCTTDVG